MWSIKGKYKVTSDQPKAELREKTENAFKSVADALNSKVPFSQGHPVPLIPQIIYPGITHQGDNGVGKGEEFVRPGRMFGFGSRMFGERNKATTML